MCAGMKCMMMQKTWLEYLREDHCLQFIVRTQSVTASEESLRLWFYAAPISTNNSRISEWILAKTEGVITGPDPNCDLVLTGTPSVTKDPNGMLRIIYQWERKGENYAKIGTTISSFFVRYGPIEDGKIAEQSEKVIVVQNPSNDSVTLSKIKACKSLGLQICAVTGNWNFRSDTWNRACVYSIDLSEYLTPVEKKLLADEEKFHPNCNLVGGRRIISIEKEGNGMLSIEYDWLPKEKNYKKIGSPISAFVVRHGPVNADLQFADELTSVNVFQKPNGNSIALTNVIPNKNYGMQICAVTDKYPFRADSWSYAWTDTLDLINVWGKETNKKAMKVV